jgi:hypothetical protein
METLKPIDDVYSPDQRSLYWRRLSTAEQITIGDRYTEIASIRLSATVPDAVRSYFATLQNLCLYALPIPQPINFPREATFSLCFAAEFINQLFPPP